MADLTPDQIGAWAAFSAQIAIGIWFGRWAQKRARRKAREQAAKPVEPATNRDIRTAVLWILFIIACLSGPVGFAVLAGACIIASAILWSRR